MRPIRNESRRSGHFGSSKTFWLFCLVQSNRIEPIKLNKAQSYFVPLTWNNFEERLCKLIYKQLASLQCTSVWFSLARPDSIQFGSTRTSIIQPCSKCVYVWWCGWTGFPFMLHIVLKRFHRMHFGSDFQIGSISSVFHSFININDELEFDSQLFKHWLPTFGSQRHKASRTHAHRPDAVSQYTFILIECIETEQSTGFSYGPSQLSAASLCLFWSSSIYRQ